MDKQEEIDKIWDFEAIIDTISICTYVSKRIKQKFLRAAKKLWAIRLGNYYTSDQLPTEKMIDEVFCLTTYVWREKHGIHRWFWQKNPHGEELKELEILETIAHRLWRDAVLLRRK